MPIRLATFISRFMQGKVMLVRYPHKPKGINKVFKGFRKSFLAVRQEKRKEKAKEKFSTPDEEGIEDPKVLVCQGRRGREISIAIVKVPWEFVTNTRRKGMRELLMFSFMHLLS